jgi:hypothetical protein
MVLFVLFVCSLAVRVVEEQAIALRAVLDALGNEARFFFCGFFFKNKLASQMLGCTFDLTCPQALMLVDDCPTDVSSLLPLLCDASGNLVRLLHVAFEVNVLFFRTIVPETYHTEHSFRTDRRTARFRVKSDVYRSLLVCIKDQHRLIFVRIYPSCFCL